MDREKFNNLLVTEKGSWQKDAERRRKWRWLTKLTLRPRIKYYRLKRKFFTLFMHFVIKVKRAVCQHKRTKYIKTSNKWQCIKCGETRDWQTDL